MFLMTGSSVRKQKSGGVNLLGGRALEKRLHPLCYPEIRDRDEYSLERIFRTGLLPEMYLYPSEADEALEAYEGLYLETEIQCIHRATSDMLTNDERRRQTIQFG